MDWITIGGYAFGIAGGVFTLLSRIPSQTIAQQKELIEVQERRLKSLEDQSKADHKMHVQNGKDIAGLQGQIKVYKELPLQEMASSMELLAKSNAKILEILTSSAISLRQDTQAAADATQQVAKALLQSDLTQVVDQQTVVHQTVKNKE